MKSVSRGVPGLESVPPQLHLALNLWFTPKGRAIQMTLPLRLPRTFRLVRRKRRRSVDILRAGVRRLYRPTMTLRRLNRP